MPYIFDVDLPLSCTKKDRSSHHTHYRYASAVPLSAALILDTAFMGENNGTHASSASSNITVAEALEIARDYHPEQARNPQVVQILDAAIAHIWGKLQTEPQSYVLTRDEFAVFNFFQHQFEGDAIAVAARKRYWNSLSVPVTRTD